MKSPGNIVIKIELFLMSSKPTNSPANYDSNTRTSNVLCRLATTFVDIAVSDQVDLILFESSTRF